MTVVACADGTTVTEAAIDRLALGMPAERLLRWRRISHRPTARSSVLAYWLARVVLDRATHGGDSARGWLIDERGKPRLVDGPPFNLSHTKEVQVCAVSGRQVGIDAERVDERAVEACRVIATERERGVIDASAEPADAATLLWAMKESFAKRSGEGLSEELASTDLGEPLSDTRFESWRLRDHWIVSCDHEGSESHGDLEVLPAADLVSASDVLLSGAVGGVEPAVLAGQRTL
ncbi:4'-phosphopantetheinyl transferase superfamily protein [Cryobacterium sp. 1639]|uniref:4'-phosphopantetheinyl transferase family protein n=1 Tax=Cryobacterium inferilacus TaxID=2866629 RepID=UPI001C73D374|nr:4'-phosphopantetheinyl transferase superfamily protein [Cryobacterium sp. 1639]MBX0301897.1 4'-phosphopantetheinyl transferase superfamily protein [Cryobacterium sp. 1639]